MLPRMKDTLPELIPAIQVIGLTKSYNPSSVLALDSLSMTVRQGEIFGFLGPNGAGKTTTIRLLMDLIRPTSGRAQILGMDCNEFSLQVRQRVGYLPGELRLYGSLNGHKLIKLFSSLRSEQVSQEYVMCLCQQLDVDLDTQLNRLSHGSRQKIGLVLALMPQPDLLILDEPTTGLDPLVRHQVLDCLREARSEGRTVFLSSHVLTEVEQVCDRVGIIRQGRLVAVEHVQMLRERRVQRIRIDFAGPIEPRSFSSLAGVQLLKCTEMSVHLEVTGEPDAVVKAASRYHVVSIESEQSSLEDVFLAHYQTIPKGPDYDEETNA